VNWAILTASNSLAFPGCWRQRARYMTLETISAISDISPVSSGRLTRRLNPLRSSLVHHAMVHDPN
jgi:hypothetical protein